jgi:hypothetical protein
MNVAKRERRMLLPLASYCADAGAASLGELVDAKKELLVKKRVPAPIAQRASDRLAPWLKETAELTMDGARWLRCTDVSLRACEDMLDGLGWVPRKFKTDWQNTNAFHSTFKGVACMTLGWSEGHVMLRPQECVAMRHFKCGGKNGCGSGCPSRLRMFVFNSDPLTWVVWRCVPEDAVVAAAQLASQGIQALEAQFHCPLTPADYTAKIQDAKHVLSLKHKRSMQLAVLQGITPARHMSADRGLSFVAHLSMKNGVTLSEDAQKRADFVDPMQNPSTSAVRAFMRRAKAKFQLDRRDDKSVDKFLKKVGTLNGLNATHIKASELHGEYCTVATDEMLAEAWTNGIHMFGLDAGHGVDQYGHKHWEITGRREQTGSGVPLALVNSSDGSPATQTAFLSAWKKMVEDHATKVTHTRAHTRRVRVYTHTGAHTNMHTLIHTRHTHTYMPGHRSTTLSTPA